MFEKMKKKVKEVSHSMSAKMGVVTAGLASALAVGASAADPATPITSDAWSGVITALTSQISVTTVVGVLSTAVAACVGLAFMWWGVRKAVRMLMAAFKKGKVSV